MKLKRAICLILSIMMIFVMLTGCKTESAENSSTTPSIQPTQDTTATEENEEPAADITYDDEELARAVELGVGKYSADDKTVTFAEFMAMLDKVVSFAGKYALESWQNILSAARESEKTMTRREGMVAVYLAAEAMGEDYYIYNNSSAGMMIFHEIEAVDDWIFWDEMWDGDYGMFPILDTATLNGEASYINAAYFYSMYRISMSNGKTIFDYDSEIKSMRPADPFTYTEALRAALRLYESGQVIQARPLTDADREILEKADLRRETILNSATEITVSGTSYYVSAEGNDDNDGKSEKTPWATLEKVNNANLQPGDGVFFRRGDIWRGEALITQNGVTYSAYGEGPKPAIYGSPENGSGAEKWSLLEGTDNIWVFYKDIMDCGDIVLDGDMDIADKSPVWWNGSGYAMDVQNMTPKPEFDPATDMKDLQYFNDIDYSDLGTQYPIYVFSHSDRKGKLYLRCDSGNPGEIYESIEFCCDPNNGSVVTMNLGPGSVIDNLCVLYGGHAIECMGGKAVQNCEVGYMGAMTHTFYDSVTIYSGDGIIHGNNLLVENNYVHHTFNFGIALGELSFGFDESFADIVEIQENNTARGNLLEYTCGISLINWEEEVNELHMFKNILIEDNYVLYSTSAGDQKGSRLSEVIGALVFGGSGSPLPCANEDMVIKDNIFYCSTNALIISGMPEEYYPVYSGNTYAQYVNMPFAYWLFRDGVYKTVYTDPSYDLETFVRDELGDQEGIVLPAE